MKEILFFLDNFDTGGVTSVIQNIYRNIDRTKYSIDFVRRNTNINEFDNEVKRSGNTVFYYEDCGLNKIPIWNYKRRQLFISKQVVDWVKASGKRYDVIHIHANPIIGLYLAKKLDIRIRIMHAHEAVSDFGDNITQSKLIFSIWKNRQKHYNEWATVKAGDSLKACVVKFGPEVVNDSKMVVLYPPVDMNRFNPQNYTYPDSGSHDGFNIIHVGRLNPVKNQQFMIDILAEINKKREADLYIVGEGRLMESLQQHACELNVLNHVHFLPGNTSPGLYTRMNCSLLPSFSEAFGMVAVESQLMGVPCFASTNVPTDVDIGMCTFLDLEIGAAKWAEAIMEYDYKHCTLNQKQKKEFDIETLLSKLERIYNGV